MTAKDSVLNSPKGKQMALLSTELKRLVNEEWIEKPHDDDDWPPPMIEVLSQST
jgi:hypothetical protein